VRDGFRFIDSDTHVGPNVETLEQHAGPVLRRRWDELRPYYQPVTEGHHLSIDPIPYKRDLNTGTAVDQTRAGGAGGEIPLRKAISLNYTEKPAPEVNNANWQGRLEDMDREGVDVHLIFPATFSTAASVFDPELQTELYAAYHRYLFDYCGSTPDRLKATILASGADPEWSAAEIARLAPEPWVSAVTVVLAEGMPADDPSLDPIWRAMDNADLPLVHHSFFYEPPYFPGYRDIWGNLAIARMAAHPWGAQRLLAYVLLSGLFDRYPNLRIGFAECSGGWVGGWINRLEYQADYLAARLPEIKRTPLEYAQEGRIYCGIELDEGPAVAKGVAEVVGEGVLMYSSDYPHGGCRFPRSTDVVLAWRDELGDDHLRRICSENAARFLRLDA
jgi:predicted TIM-barrel fold metal-dependent hydrolase